MSNFNTALSLALEGHADQIDQAGERYILHVLRVMLRQKTDRQRIVALLHDWKEDAGGTDERLRQLGFSEDIIADVDALTKRSGESRTDAAERAARRPVALAVKSGDNADNRNVDRLASKAVSAKDITRLAQYEEVRGILFEAAHALLETDASVAGELPLENLLQPSRYDLPGYGDEHTIHIERITPRRNKLASGTAAPTAPGQMLPYYAIVNEAGARYSPADGVWELRPHIAQGDESELEAFIQRTKLSTLNEAGAAALQAIREQQKQREQLQQRRREILNRAR